MVESKRISGGNYDFYDNETEAECLERTKHDPLRKLIQKTYKELELKEKNKINYNVQDKYKIEVPGKRIHEEIVKPKVNKKKIKKSKHLFMIILILLIILSIVGMNYYPEDINISKEVENISKNITYIYPEDLSEKNLKTARMMTSEAQILYYGGILSEDKCKDKTQSGQCSKNKPLYCLNGILIKKSSLCGCSFKYVVEGDKCISKYQIGAKNIKFYYGHNYIEYTVYNGLNNHLKSLDRSISYTIGESQPTTKDFIMKKLDNQKQKEFLDPLVNEIRKKSLNQDTQVKIAIRMVQHIPYDYIGVKSNTLTGKYPYEVLYTQTGVCSEKSELLAYILRELGYGVALLKFDIENHQVVGIKCPSQYEYKDTRYCFVESTVPSVIGDSYKSYVGVGKLKSTPEVIKISDGKTLQNIR